MIDLDRFNTRCRGLIAVIEAIRRDLRDQKLDPTDPGRLVDSAPVTLMIYPRGARSKSAVGNEFFGVITSKKGEFFGLRLHVTPTVDQLIDEWLLAPASIPDLQALDDLVLDCRDRVLIGDKIYNDAEWEERLWRKRRIQLLPLRKRHQKNHGLRPSVASWGASGIGWRPSSAPGSPCSMGNAPAGAAWLGMSCASPPDLGAHVELLHGLT